MALSGYIPFGSSKSFASMDAGIQYIDFYAYLKDVLAGKNSFSYTFSNMLGGGAFAIFSYYLSSPINLLVLFFNKGNLRAFFDIAVVIKLSLAAFTCSWFLVETFRERINNRLKYAMTVVLSVSYALCQYNIAQSSNIMWLDGVYMLPVVLLLIHKFVTGESRGWKLAVAVGYMIIANWYSAGINCIFSGVWFIFEYARNFRHQKTLVEQLVDLVKKGVSYVAAMLVGIMLSSVLFIPTIRALQGSSRGDLKIDRFFNSEITGNMKTVIQNYVYGAMSAENSAALFCGCIVAVGVIAFFLNGRIKVNVKVKCGFLLAFAVLSMYWKPLITAFSMLQDINGYWYRYSYLAVFVLVYIAGEYFLGSEYGAVPTAVSSVLLALAIVLLHLNHHVQTSWNTYLTALMIIVTGLFFSLLVLLRSRNPEEVICRVAVAALCALCIGDVSYNFILLMNRYAASDGIAGSRMMKESDEQVRAIRDLDNGTYRITQTYTDVNANYDEAFAHNYWSLAGYTSSPNDMQRSFLDRSGYNIMGPNLCVVNTSMLGIDSFLGTKYVMSAYPINGLKEVKGIGRYNGRRTYLNPYALPMAVTYRNNSIAYNTANCFEYQNSLYSSLVGRNVSVYKPLKAELVQEGNVAERKSMKYRVNLSASGMCAVYGTIPWNSWINATLNVDGKYHIPYAQWLSPVVFHVPSEKGAETETLSLSSDMGYDIRREGVAFYALDLKELKKVTSELKADKPEYLRVRNGDIKVRARVKEAGNSLYLSVPCDKGWTVKLNGDDVQTRMIGDCLYSIPLKKGRNVLVMHYRVPGLAKGLVLSIAGILLVLLWVFGDGLKRRMIP